MTVDTALAGGLLTSPEVIEQTGISYRRLDYWTRCGLITPAGVATTHGVPLQLVGGKPRDAVSPGSGHWRTWHPDEVEVIRRVLALVDAGVGPRAAAKAARNGGHLAPGVRVVFEDAS